MSKIVNLSASSCQLCLGIHCFEGSPCFGIGPPLPSIDQPCNAADARDSMHEHRFDGHTLSTEAINALRCSTKGANGSSDSLLCSSDAKLALKMAFKKDARRIG